MKSKKVALILAGSLLVQVLSIPSWDGLNDKKTGQAADQIVTLSPSGGLTTAGAKSVTGASVRPSVTSVVTATVKPSVIPSIIPSVTPSVTPSATPAFTDDGEDDEETTSTKKLLKKDTVKKKGSLYYIVQKATKSKRTVSVYSAAKQSAKTVNIPESVKLSGYTYRVTGIYENAFKDMKKLSKVTIGYNVTSIGKAAFRRCKKIKEITLPENVTTIGEKAFCECRGLNYLQVDSKKISRVGHRAFRRVGKQIRIKTPSGKWRVYAKMFREMGRMRRKARYIVKVNKEMMYNKN